MQGLAGKAYGSNNSVLDQQLRGGFYITSGYKMLKRFKKYFISNYEKIKLSMSLMLGITALILLLFYLAGCLLDLWKYNIIDLVFNPLAGSIIVTVPVFSAIIILRFFNYDKTRALFCTIVKTHRSNVNFFLQKDDGGNPDNEIKYILWGNYKDSSFRFTYSLGHPLMISLICNKAETNLIVLHKMLQKLKLKGIRLNCYGLTLEIDKAFSEGSLNGIPDKLDLLINDFSLLMSETREAV
jgi:hypothetical protein